ncbi:LacI family DNA-binding transcriptional regulator [Microbacterium allomyrinae]|uniref:LacI family DNA-binding transcriptional regulator n=1 Tax=Microbacterium allomyrinae TaxID=2830666 RepID=A0A9X1LU36_9MICO|nr:LacI family DNA-binding transcriptional regulator [Microbacterium allomyrinae]MCC2031731.1 LacI family DNA-binding transcriptional regulator [Microbacterium allomyrinae]
MSRTPKASQRTIAELANVSQSAVSLVVSGRAEANRIPAETRIRIEQVIREVGYVPNVAARLLKGTRNGLIGVHTYERVFPVREDDYYHEFLVGIEEAAVTHGVDLVLFSSTLRDDGSRAVFTEGMNRLRLADGSIFMGLAQDDDELAQLARDGYPFVFIGRRTVGSDELTHVTADYAGGVAATIDALQAMGHRRINYVGTVERDDPHNERLRAYRDEMSSRSLDARVVTLVPSRIDNEWDDMLTAEPTALMVETLELADAVATCADDRGLSIPADLSCVVLDTPSRSGAASGWSSMALPKREMGAAALQLLQRCMDESIRPQPVTLPVSTPGNETIAPPIN